MSNEDGSILLAFNGEIYNFRELKSEFDLAEGGQVSAHGQELGEDIFARLRLAA